MVSFTITEKGYSLVDGNGEYLPDVAGNLPGGPENAKSYMGRLTPLLCACYRKNKATHCHGQHGQLLSQRGQAQGRCHHLCGCLEN